MNGLRDLLASERGAFCIFVLVVATALVFMGKLSSSEWLEYTKWLTGILVVSKTITTAVDTHVSGRRIDIPPARVVKAPTEGT